MQVCLWHICTDTILHPKQIPKCFIENVNAQQHCSTALVQHNMGTRVPWGGRKNAGAPPKTTPAKSRGQRSRRNQPL